MKSYLDLIPISAKAHKKQSRMTMICIVLAVFLVTAIFSMADMEMRSQKLQIIKGNGNWHVMFNGIDQQTGAMIAARPEVKASGWYTYPSEKTEYTLSGKSVNVAGMDKNVFEDMSPTKITEGVYPTKKNEVVLAENAKSTLGINVGDIITLEHSGLKPIQLSVVGFAQGTSKLLKQDNYALLFTTEGFCSTVPKDMYTSAYIVQLSEHCNMQKVIADITQQYHLTDKQVLQNGNLLGVLGQSNNSYMLQLYSTAAILFIVVLLAGILMIASSLIGILSGIAVGIFTVLLAARAPAKKAARVSPLSAVSGNANAVQPVRTEANTTIFKIETALGIHHATSSRKNFLLMVGSFSLSIILFLCFSATVDFMHHALKPLKPWAPDISIISSDNTCSISSSLIKQLKDNTKVKRVYGRMFDYNIPVKVNGQDKVINLISYEDYQFSWAKDALIKGSIDDVRQKENQVLVVYDSESSLHVRDTLKLGSGKEVTVAGLLSSSPFDQVKGVETVICSEATFRELTGETNYTIIDIQLFNGATDDDVNAIRSLAGPNIQFSDCRAGNREAIGAFYSMALFIYGFLVIVALITIFNIVNSVSMSVSARIKQYGAMRAIGMSNQQLVKMVKSEAIMYSVAGSIVGCIVGLPLHKRLFEKMITSHWGDPWQLPFGALGMIVAIVIIASIFAVKSPAKRIHNMSIVDTINAQ